ncbi:MAG: FAD-binding oxidoreductase [Nanoarchaeota archaeon]|nr:FAD-binding oxidoreductase [Nanoarchaeota archaeon]
MKEKIDISIVPVKIDASGEKGSNANVLFPASVLEVQQLVKAGNSIYIRGGGTGFRGGCVAHKNSIVIDMKKFDSLYDVDLGKSIAYVGVGITLDELNRKVSKYGLEFPVDLASKKVATIGGMIAMNASDSREMKYGKTGDWIQELEAVKGNGDLVKVGITDMSDFSGVEGISGIIVNAKVRLVEKKKRTASFFKVDNFHRVIEIAKKLKLNKNVSMIEFYDKKVSKFLDLEEGYYILVEYESDEGRLKGEDYIKILKLKKSVYFKLMSNNFNYIEDFKLYLEKLDSVVDYLEELKIPFTISLGNGVVHPFLNKVQKKLLSSIYRLVRHNQGKLYGKFGVGVMKREHVDSIDKKVMFSMKKRYDSEFKFNPDVFVNIKEAAELK